MTSFFSLGATYFLVQRIMETLKTGSLSHLYFQDVGTEISRTAVNMVVYELLGWSPLHGLTATEHSYLEWLGWWAKQLDDWRKDWSMLPQDRLSMELYEDLRQRVSDEQGKNMDQQSFFPLFFSLFFLCFMHIIYGCFRF